jgi:hypothetical protein
MVKYPKTMVTHPSKEGKLHLILNLFQGYNLTQTKVSLLLAAKLLLHNRRGNLAPPCHLELGYLGASTCPIEAGQDRVVFPNLTARL